MRNKLIASAALRAILGSTPARASLVALSLASVSACKDTKQEAAQRSLAQMNGHVQQARQGAARFVTGFAPLIASLAPSVAGPLAAASEDNVRFELIGMRTRQTDAGSLTLFPTGFVAAINREGVAVARDVPRDDDHMRGMNLGALFPVIRAAINGTAGTGIGEFPAHDDQPAKVYLVCAAPVRDANGAVVGALAAGVSFSSLARAIDTAVRNAAGPQPVLWVGLRRNGRVMPSGTDRDIAPRWLIPAPLVATIPANVDARLTGTAPVTWSFVEGGQRGWAGALATVPELEGTAVLLYRSEADQR